MIELLTRFDILIVSLITTFLVSAITGLFDDTFRVKKYAAKWLVVITAIVVSYLNNAYVKGGEIPWQEYLLSFLISWAFAVLFYSYLGMWVVRTMFKKLKEKLSNEKL